MHRPRLLLSWSSGKDSAWTLELLRRRGDFEVVGLVTTLNEAHDRVAMHAVRRKLLEAQAEAAELPLWLIPLPDGCSNEQYEARMSTVVERAQREGITHMAFGDLYLEDIRAYREARLAGTGVTPVFPLWQLPTGPLARTMIDAGVVAHLTCVDPRKLPAELAGRRFDHALLAELPDGIDPCGENGEFHSFVSAGPMLKRPLDVRVGEVVERGGFVFADVLPSDMPGTQGPAEHASV